MPERCNNAAPDEAAAESGDDAAVGRRLRADVLEQVFRSRLLRERAQQLAEALLALSRRAAR
jgi:hypothetical protein